jgi:hypothetical protein
MERLQKEAASQECVGLLHLQTTVTDAKVPCYGQFSLAGVSPSLISISIVLGASSAFMSPYGYQGALGKCVCKNKNTAQAVKTTRGGRRGPKTGHTFQMLLEYAMTCCFKFSTAMKILMQLS